MVFLSIKVIDGCQNIHWKQEVLISNSAYFNSASLPKCHKYRQKNSGQHYDAELKVTVSDFENMVYFILMLLSNIFSYKLK